MDADDKTLARIQGLLNLAAKNSSPEEAAAAGAKAQELLARYNLDVATVENAQAIKDGKREEAKVNGGAYRHQRDLWEAVAKLNFCLYWTQRYDVWTKGKRVGSGRARYTTEGYVEKKRHALVGRMVNTRATIAMAGYLEQAIKRALIARLHGDGDDPAQVKIANEQRFSRWAVSFRQGATRRVVEKLKQRREEQAEAAMKKADADRARAERAGASTASAVTIADVTLAELNANVDFRFGDGTSAKWAKQRAERARREREADEEYTRRCVADPLFAAAEAKRRREEEIKFARRKGRGSTAKETYDRGAYWSGYDVAAAIGLEQQADRAAQSGAIGRTIGILSHG